MGLNNMLKPQFLPRRESMRNRLAQNEEDVQVIRCKCAENVAIHTDPLLLGKLKLPHCA